jgi:hypothetical protein
MLRLSTAILVAGFCCFAVAFGGCANRPYHGFGALNPVLRDQWKADEEYGPTYHQRMAEMKSLRRRAARLDATEQEQIAVRMSDLIRDDRNALYRAEAAKILGEIPGETAERGLLIASEDLDEDVRLAACEAWGRRGGAQAVTSLSRLAAADEDVDVRRQAIEQLGKFTEQPAIDALAQALDDRDPSIQLTAAESLEKATGENFGQNVPAWRAYVRGEPLPDGARPSIAQQIINWF